MSEQLVGLSSQEIDQLPFGYIALDSAGNILKYNRYEAELARLDQESVLGKNFFKEVAPCTQVREFEGRFQELAEGRSESSTLSFDFVFKFRHGAQNVRIGFIRSPRKDEIIVTVNRLRMEQMALSTSMEFEETTGEVRDSAGNRVVFSGKDLWRSLATTLPASTGEQMSKLLYRVGQQWGLQHAQRADNLVQREQTSTLRETGLEAAIGLLSQSIGVLGLGTFEAEFSHRDAGLIVILHRSSPFVEFYPEYEKSSCPLLAGLHAGLFTHLSNQSLGCREVYCSQRSEDRCVFVLGTDKRLQVLTEDPADADLLRTIVSYGPATEQG
ncbi:MAG: V4R domain-containing protein [Acidobacteriota bacterium]